VNQQRVTAASDFFNKIDPLLPFKIRPLNEWEAPGSGLWLKAGVAPGAAVAVLQREFFRTDLSLPRPM
jgi:hypothetical protein